MMLQQQKYLKAIHAFFRILFDLQFFINKVQIKVTPRHFFTTGNQILVIVDTQWSDAGVYSCRISNSLGTAKGTTRLQVLTASGEAVEASSSSFGLDDKSTTTGIIIIAVVCCVVGTSLVWVIIIYQTRKRHEMYSAAPS
ncbi:leucine-rich repeats and immunoglobulin-like domains protein 3, partial [Elysia marginata]